MSSVDSLQADGLDVASPHIRSNALRTIWKHRLTFLIVFIGVMCVSVIALKVLPTRYLATGSVIVAEPEPGGSNTSAEWAQKIGDPADLESQILVIRSPRVMRLALAQPGVLDLVRQECLATENEQLLKLFGTSSPCEKLSLESDEALNMVATRYGVGGAGRSRVIDISYQSTSPEIAQKLANALVNAYLDDQRANLAGTRELASNWLRQEVKSLDAEIRVEDAKIQAYRRDKGLMRGANAPITSELLTGIAQQLSTAEATRAEMEAKLREIRADQSNGTANSQAVLENRAVADLKQQLSTISIQLASASQVLGRNHPAFRSLVQEQEAVKARLAAEVANIAASAKKNFDTAASLTETLRRRLAAAKADAGAATADEAAIENMVRSTELKRQQSAELYKRASDLETERRILIGSTRLVSLAELPAQPFFPKRLPFLAGGMTLGLMLGFLAAYLRARWADDDSDHPPMVARGAVASKASAPPRFIG